MSKGPGRCQRTIIAALTGAPVVELHRLLDRNNTRSQWIKNQSASERTNTMTGTDSGACSKLRSRSRSRQRAELKFLELGCSCGSRIGPIVQSVVRGWRDYRSSADRTCGS
jgi:hypothetical protein